ncbi:hypothetical protein Ancab_029118 [Ancistrocladus abbreviatus]
MAARENSGDGLASNLAGMSKNQLYEIMSQMKALIEQNQKQAKQILIDNPLLTRALFQAQIMLGMVQPPQVIPNTQAQALEPPQLPAQKVQQTNTSVVESLPSLAEQANSSESQIPVRKHQQNQSSTPTLSSPMPGFQSRSMPLQPLQQSGVNLSSQATPMSLPQSSQVHNLPSLPLQQPAVHPPRPPGHLQRPMQTTGMPHLPLQPPLLPQHRPQLSLPHQLQSQMGPNMRSQHPGLPQPHHSQPPFHSHVKAPGSLGPSFPHGQPPLPSQLPPQPLYQGGPHNQGRSSIQMERGSNWLPGLPEIAGVSQHPGPPQLGHGPINLGNQPPPPAQLTPEMELALQQVMSLTPEQINLLPPEQQHQVLQLQLMLRQQTQNLNSSSVLLP